MAKDFYKYNDPEDERLLLTPEMIKGNDRSELRGEIIYCIFVFLGLALMGGFTGFCIWRFHFAVNSPVSPYIITVPLMILTAYVLGFFICQIVQTVIPCDHGHPHQNLRGRIRQDPPFFP